MKKNRKPLIIVVFLLLAAAGNPLIAQERGAAELSFVASRFKEDLHFNYPAFGIEGKLRFGKSAAGRFSMGARYVRYHQEAYHDRPLNQQYMHVTAGYQFSMQPFYLEPQFGIGVVAKDRSLYLVPGLEAGYRYRQLHFGLSAHYATQQDLLFGGAHFMTAAKIGYTLPF